jgi:hypothetical protein
MCAYPLYSSEVPDLCVHLDVRCGHGAIGSRQEVHTLDTNLMPVLQAE